MTLTKLIHLDPSKKCLQFLHDRILANNYRGNQISQHNRYSFEDVVEMIKTLFSKVGESQLKIRTKDISKRPYNLPDEKKYAEYVSEVNQKIGKGTQDSIRKNYFVDFHRMGLLYRFTENGAKIEPFENSLKTVTHVQLTSLAKELLNSLNNKLESYTIFTRCLDNLLQGLATDMFDIQYELRHITIEEYTFFLSYARLDLNGHFVSLEDVVSFVKEYRSLPKAVKLEVVSIVRDYCNPTNFSGPKTDKRDYGNWVNESQQVFTLLDMTPYYSYVKNENKLIFMVDEKSIISSDSELLKLRRSLETKKDYFKKHLINPRYGFELHHIVPLLWAKNINEFYLLDKWENLLYIDGKSHAVISQRGNKHVILSFFKDDIDLSRPDGDIISLKKTENVIYNYQNKEVILKTNRELIQSFK